MKILAIILIIGGLSMAILTFGRSVTYFENSEDTGLDLATASSSVTEIAQDDLPSRLQIPRLNIDTNVQHLGITKKGNMAAPSNYTDVSWYKFGTLPGLKGSAVIAGHEDNALSLDGVFKHLDQLQQGDDVYVVTQSGKKLHFKVRKTEVYPYDLSGPDLEKIFNASDAARLNLITCAGEWIQSEKTNDKRLVVYTEQVR